MRSIFISTSVFAAIWSHRKAGEENENAILERLLADKGEGAISPSQLILEPEVRGKVRWVDDIAAALRELGGKATLADIYDAVRVRRSAYGRSVTREYKATIRRTLEDHSSDSANHRSDDLFALLDRGLWALR